MIPYSEGEQKTLIERLFSEIVSTASGRQQYDERDSEEIDRVLPPLQLLFDLDFEQKFEELIMSIRRRMPAL